MLMLLFLAVAGLVVFAQQVVSQEKSGGGKPSDSPAMDKAAMEKARSEYMKTIAPGEQHKHLDYFVGKWKTVTKMSMGGPGGAASEFAGESDIQWVLGKRFLVEKHKGEFMGQPYEGMGMTGYDNYRNVLTMTWANTMSTAIQVMTGTRNPKTGVYTYYGAMDEPDLKVIGRTIKYVTKITDPDQYVFTVFDLHAGDDYKIFDITYTRQKS